MSRWGWGIGVIGVGLGGRHGCISGEGTVRYTDDR